MSPHMVVVLLHYTGSTAGSTSSIHVDYIIQSHEEVVLLIMNYI